MAEKNNWTAERAFSEYHERILRYIRARIPSLQEAEDVCSAVFLKAICCGKRCSKNLRPPSGRCRSRNATW